MKKLLPAIIVIGLTSCKQSQTKGDTKTMDFGEFTIEAPNSWKQIYVQGTDSYVGKIAVDESDTLHFDLGWYSNDLKEYQEVKLGDSNTYYISSYDSADSPTLFDSIQIESIVKSRISWDTIDGRRAKFLSPIKSGVGTTGIYIDSLWQAGSDIDKFNMYGTNLKPRNEKTVLAAIKTLKFHKTQ